MRNAIRGAAIVVLMTVAVACADAPSPVAAPSPTPLEPPTDLEGALTAWAAADVGSYSLRVKTSCFCMQQDYRIVVDDDGTVQEGAPEQYLPETVDDLHAILQEAYDADAAEVRVTFDAIGVPVSVYIDRAENMADEEIGYEVSFEDQP
jgi:hypothetical protein